MITVCIYIYYKDVNVLAHDSEDYDHDKFFSAYTPAKEDGCYLADPDNIGVDSEICW